MLFVRVGHPHRVILLSVVCQVAQVDPVVRHTNTALDMSASQEDLLELGWMRRSIPRDQVDEGDVHALPAGGPPAVDIVPGRHVPGVAGVALPHAIGSERPAGDVILDGAVFRNARLPAVLESGSLVARVGSEIARGLNLDLDSVEEKLVVVARRQERSELLDVSQTNDVAGAEARIGISVSFDPIQHGLIGDLRNRDDLPVSQRCRALHGGARGGRYRSHLGARLRSRRSLGRLDR